MTTRRLPVAIAVTIASGWVLAGLAFFSCMLAWNAATKRAETSFQYIQVTLEAGLVILFLFVGMAAVERFFRNITEAACR